MQKEINATFIRTLGIGHLINFTGRVNDVCIDSRKVTSGSLFVALKGKKTDGHQFIRNSLTKGASLCMVSAEWARENQIDELPLWIVDSPEEALQKMASEWRQQFQIPVFAIAGTNGKTTTRSMCKEVLSKKYRIHSTTGNLNNQLGLPLTLLGLRESHNFSVLEMGTNHFGEIASLCAIAKPTAGLITNVGLGHIEFFGSLEGVAKSKEELFQKLPENGIAFINNDDELIRKMRTPAEKVTYGMNAEDVDYFGKILSYTDEGCPVLKVNRKVVIPLIIPGTIAANNALAAFAVGSYFGISDIEIAKSLSEYHPVNQRFNIIHQEKFTIINDTYNANPDSTIAALKTLSQMKTAGRRIFIFGDMLELGDFSEKGHSLIGKTVADLKINSFFAVGKLSKAAIESAKENGMVSAFHFETKKDLIDELKRQISINDIILVKGSRGSQMEEIVKGLTE